MFDEFNKYFKVDSGTKAIGSSPDLDVDNDINKLIKMFGGCSFNSGLYRVLRGDQIASMTRYLRGTFSKFDGPIVAFAYNWSGCTYALNYELSRKDKAEIYLMEPGTGDALEIPFNVLDFHNDVLVNETHAATYLDFFNSWKNESGIGQIGFDQCVGYKTPLFLSGADKVENLELSDLDVYLDICSQLLHQTRDLPEGTKINDIRFG